VNTYEPTDTHVDGGNGLETDGNVVGDDGRDGSDG
jgi:hypothetical protein